MRWIARLVLVVAVGGCSDNITNNYTIINEGPTSVVQAKVFGWRCGIGDFYNNPEGPGRFTSSNPLRAQITFESVNGNSHSEYTSDS